MPTTFDNLMRTLPNLPPNYRKPADFDWALHPGGATILQGVESVMNITAEHQRASYDTYMKHGNSSSATIFSVLNRLRHKEMDALAPGGKVKDFVVSCAFGPGVTIEMVMLKRNLNHVRRPADLPGVVTPPETGSERGVSDGEGELDSENGDAFLDEVEIVHAAEEVLLSELVISEMSDVKGPAFLSWPNSNSKTVELGAEKSHQLSSLLRGPHFLLWPNSC